MTAPEVREHAPDPADGEVGDALAIASPLTVPRTVEELVIGALTHGFEADFDAWRGTEPSVVSDAGWDEARTLRGEFVVELCTSVRKGTRSFPRGIRIRGARILGNIDLITGSVDALLLLERCRITGGVTLRDCTTRLVNLAGSCVCGDVSADRLRSSAGVYLREHFVCNGSVRLSAAVIDGDLDCGDATILGVNPGKKPNGEDAYALRCDRMRVTGSVLLRGLSVTSAVRLLDAKVGANVVCDATTLKNPGGVALFADNARIEGSLVLRDWHERPDGLLSFRNATAAVLQLGAHDEKWPRHRTVRAQGFRFTTLETDGLVNRALCERWLELLVRDPFSPQPYEKCAQVLRENGLGDDAKEIAIRRRRVQRELPGVSWWRYAMDVLLDRLIGYGYRPGRSVAMLAFLALLGTAVFGFAQYDGAMVPADTALSRVYRAHPDSLPPGYPPLVAPVYSLDVLLPIIDFQQDSKWRPDTDRTIALTSTRVLPIGWIVLAFAWMQIALGWVLSTLLVGSITGLIRKE